MRTVFRCIITAGCMVAFATPALAQFNSGAPWGPDTFAGLEVTFIDRTALDEDIAHYRFWAETGPGEFDKVRIHRVVREGKQARPKDTVEGMFLLPGSPQFFEGIFMPAPEQSFAIYLARNGIDVWGMDWGWDFVPAGTTDFSMFEGWGVEKDARHTDLALSVARRIRTLTGQGNGRLHLLGFSYGVHVAYAVAGEETQRPPGHRNVKGLIPVDLNFKVSTVGARSNNCNGAITTKANALDNGIYEVMEPLALIGNLAQSAPDDWSPFFRELTNYEFAVFIGIPGFVTGTPPASLTYTDPDLWVDLLATSPVYRTQQAAYDMSAARCDDDAVAPVAFDDHLDKIALPIFYVGKHAAFGMHAATLTASADISQWLVNPPATPNLAHGDLFLAPDAETWVWSPILEWVLARKANPEPF